jgi:hypothetical protein
MKMSDKREGMEGLCISMFLTIGSEPKTFFCRVEDVFDTLPHLTRCTFDKQTVICNNFP